MTTHLVLEAVMMIVGMFSMYYGYKILAMKREGVELNVYLSDEHVHQRNMIAIMYAIGGFMLGWGGVDHLIQEWTLEMVGEIEISSTRIACYGIVVIGFSAILSIRHLLVEMTEENQCRRRKGE